KSADLLTRANYKIPLLFFFIQLCVLSTILGFDFWGNFPKQHPSDLQIPKQLSVDLPGCLAVFSGNTEDKKIELEALLSSRRRRSVVTEDFYMNATKDCSSYIKKQGFISVPLSEEEKSFPIAFSVVIHEKIEIFERLLRAIYAPQNIYCVHVDQKSPRDFQRAVKAIIENYVDACFPNVFIASKLESVIYASWSRVQADLNCMKDLLYSHIQWTYLLNTCGTDFSIKTNREMVKALKALNGRNSLETEATGEYKKVCWQYHHNVTDDVIRTSVRKTLHPSTAPCSQEMPTLWLQEPLSNIPDEHLWATLQRMPSVPGSVPANIRYDMSDMNALARVVKWAYSAGDVNKGAPYYSCTGECRGAVCVYGAGDISWLLTQVHLFSVLRFKALELKHVVLKI
uniref:Beta-1,3-galactosyl-O-glycosyl-glycoprotein beta-1,6-N-acetylglucosaminyltransferase 3 n=1 Tax=Nothobranchius furzeri TaxID=105023 RepID=A0A8C6NUQ5_NOTFU